MSGHKNTPFRARTAVFPLPGHQNAPFRARSSVYPSSDKGEYWDLIRTGIDKAFKDFFRDNNIHRTVIEAAFPAQNAQETNSEILSFIQKNPHVGGIAVVISAGYLVSDALKANGIKNIVVGGFDVTHGNARCIEEGTLDFLINQHPERQGFNAVESTLHYLLYGASDHTLKEYLPIDIVFRENLPFWYEE